MAVLDIILYPTVIAVGFFIRVLPPAISLWIARRLGFLVYMFYKKRRSIGYANIKAAFSETLSPKDIKKITCATFGHFTQVLFEIFRFPEIGKEYADRYVVSEGLNYIKEALAKGRGAIILTAHFGNWELSGLVGAIRGYPQDVLARQQKYLHLNKLLNSYRQRYGRRVIEKGVATRDIITSLRANKIVAILSDQDGGMNGCLVNFFGRLASTPQGAIVFALKFDSLILPNFCVRQKGAFYHMIIEPALDLEKTANLDVDIQLNMQKFTNVLQSYITKYPSQWLWLHKRWKTTPSRRVLILSDGKAGHLNQAKAVAKHIRRVVFEKAGQDERVRVLKKITNYELRITDLENLIYQEKTVEVKYKSPMHKAILTIFSLFISGACQGCMKCVKFCLTKDSYKTLMSVYADIVISCGSQIAPINRFLQKENMAKGITIMRPGILPVSKFNLCIIPMHDRPKQNKNVLVTDGALNLVDEDYLKQQTEKLAGLSAIRYQPSAIRLGLLIGGDNKNFALTKSALEKVLNAIIQIANNMNAAILATTSRRTSRDLENLVKERLAKLDNCKLLIIANERNIAQAVGGILGLSDIIIVSGESVSMVSEAASSGKKVVVFQLDAKKKNSPAAAGSRKREKHLKFLENLKEKGFIVLCKPENILDTIRQALQDKKPIKRLDDSTAIYEAIKRIV